MNNIKMLYYDRIDISEKIDVNKTSASKGYDICLLVFLHKGFVFQKKKKWLQWMLWLLRMSSNLSFIAILNIENADYCWLLRP